MAKAKSSSLFLSVLGIPVQFAASSLPKKYSAANDSVLVMHPACRSRMCQTPLYARIANGSFAPATKRYPRGQRLAILLINSDGISSLARHLRRSKPQSRSCTAIGVVQITCYLSQGNFDSADTVEYASPRNTELSRRITELKKEKHSQIHNSRYDDSYRPSQTKRPGHAFCLIRLQLLCELTGVRGLQPVIREFLEFIIIQSASPS